MDNTGNFSANQLTEIYSILEDMKLAFSQLEYAGCCGKEEYPGYDIVNLLSSEDSSLSSAWSNSCDIAYSITDKADGIISKIREEFENYIKRTLGNEEGAANTINSINGALEEDIELLSKIEI